MTKLEQCSGCRGFLPRGATKCPHCSRITKRLCAVGTTLGAGSIAFTLMACYGGAPVREPCPDGKRECYEPTTSTPEAGVVESPDAGK